MKWTLYPKNKDLTTSLPLSLEITEWKGSPKVTLEGVGELKLKPFEGKLKTDFYLALPGKYSLEIKDSLSSEVTELNIEEHRYLDFTNEFGFFLILFLFVMGGIIIWTRKIMKKKTPKI